MERALSVASGEAGALTPVQVDATTSNISLKLQAGKEEDIKMSALLRIDNPSQEDLANMGGLAKIDLVITCKEGTSDIQLGKFAGRMNTLYELALERLPMISQFGVLSVTPTTSEAGGKALLLSFVSPVRRLRCLSVYFFYIINLLILLLFSCDATLTDDLFLLLLLSFFHVSIFSLIV